MGFPVAYKRAKNPTSCNISLLQKSSARFFRVTKGNFNRSIQTQYLKENDTNSTTSIHIVIKVKRVFLIIHHQIRGRTSLGKRIYANNLLRRITDELLMHRSIRSFNNPPSRKTQGHLTDVRAREGSKRPFRGWEF